jgi:hypothetical protein
MEDFLPVEMENRRHSAILGRVKRDWQFFVSQGKPASKAG